MKNQYPLFLIHRFSLLLFLFFISFTADGQSHKCGFDGLIPSQTYIQEVEKAEQAYLKGITKSQSETRATKYTLPIVFHIIHNGGAENISEATILTGLDELNASFANTGYYDQGTGVETEIQFCLAKRTPDGSATDAINRIQNSLTDMDADTEDTSLKNLSRWDPTQYINVWIVKEICRASSGCGVAGYAYLPSAHGQPYDGIVMESAYLGSSPSNTAVLTHEMGHYLGLYHTFEGGCPNGDCLANGDRVCDTPPDQSTTNVPCSTMPNSCTTDVNSTDPNNPLTADQADMIINYMDYSDLNCYSAFTAGQKDRMQFFIENTRLSLTMSDGCLDPCLNPIIANILTANTTVDLGSLVTFTSSTTGATLYEWFIDNVAFATGLSANYAFNQEGIFTITLVANNDDPNCEESYSIDIKVDCPAVAAFVSSSNEVEPGGEVTFSNISQNATTYQWLVDGVVISNAFNFTANFPTEGNYDIQLIASNGLCSDTSSISIITVTDTPLSGTGLPIWPVTAAGSNIIETVSWDTNTPLVEVLNQNGEEAPAQTGVAVDPCGDLAFYAIHTGSSDPNDLQIFSPDGSVLLSNDTPNGPGLNAVRGLSETQVIRAPSYSNEWYIVYSEWSSDIGSPGNNAGYNPARLLYTRVRLESQTELIVLERDVVLTANGSPFTYADGKATSRTAYGSKDQHFVYTSRRSVGSSTTSVDRFLITRDNITWDGNTGNVNVPWWSLTCAGSPIELSPTEDRIAVSYRNQDRNRPDVLLFNAATFSNTDYQEISAGELILLADGTTNDESSELPYNGRVKDIANDNSLNLRFLRNYERKLSRLEFSPNGRFLYLLGGGYAQGGSTNLTYLSQIDLEASPLEVRMQIQTTTNGVYTAAAGRGCPTTDADCLDNYPQISTIQSCFDGNLYFVKRHDNLYYVIPNPNEVLPQNLVPHDVDLSTPTEPNIIMNGTTSTIPDQIDGYNYADERFRQIEFIVNAYDCMDNCLAPYELEVNLDSILIEKFTVENCPDTLFFCADTTKVYSLYAPSVNIFHNEAFIDGQPQYVDGLEYFDFSNLAGCTEICDNMIDDDFDGLIDCDDPDLQDSCCCYIPPVLDLGPDIEICTDGVFPLTANEGFASFEWSGNGQERTYTAYGPGTYTVVATDSCGGMQTDQVIISVTPSVPFDLGSDITTCPGTSTELTINGYDIYSWSPDVNMDCNNCATVTVSPDTTTTYTLVAATDDGCVSIDSITIIMGAGDFSFVDTTVCEGDFVELYGQQLEVGDTQLFYLNNEAGCDSTIEVSVSSNGFTASTYMLDTFACTNEFVNIEGIMYPPLARDTLRYSGQGGCDSLVFINVSAIPVINTDAILEICYGDSVSIFGNIENQEGEYTDTFTSTNFCDSVHTITLMIFDEISIDVITDTTCPETESGSIEIITQGGQSPYTYTWQHTTESTDTLGGLGEGEYIVNIVDNNNCALSETVSISTSPELILNINSMNITCQDMTLGSIDLSDNNNTLTYSLDGTNFHPDVAITDLEAGDYTITAIDTFGCTATGAVTITEPPVYSLSLPADTTIAIGDSIAIAPITDAVGNLTYLWTPSTGLACDACAITIAAPYGDTEYTLELTDENGCILEDNIFIQVDGSQEIHIPNIFSPNDDGINDRFFPIANKNIAMVLSMDVYDRWGERVFQNANFNLNDPQNGWDGTFKGQPVELGVYVYIIEVVLLDDTRKAYSGDITVMR